MLDEILVDKRGLHRRLARNTGPRRLDNRQNDPATTSATSTNFLFPWSIVPTTQVTGAPTTTTTTSDALPTDTLLNSPLPITTTTSSTSTSTSTSTTTSTTDTPSTTSTSSLPTSTLAPTTSAVPTTSAATLLDTSAGTATTEVDVTVTPTRSIAPSGTSLAASPTASTTSSSSVSHGVVIGGIIAAVIGVAGILFAIIYFVRRSRSNDEDDGNDFNADAFRRQSTMIPDDEISGFSRAMSYNRGGGARPPTMIEQRMANVPASYMPPPMPAHPYGGYDAYNSFAPGQIVTPYTPTTVNSANPFFSSYDSPVASPAAMPEQDGSYDAEGNTVRHPSNASSAVLSRQTSVASTNKPLPDPTEDAQYVDLARSSVTPYQAAQYAEISRRLNTTPPQPLSAVNEEFERPQEIMVHVQSEVEPLEFQPSISFDEGHRLNVQPTPRENSFPESPFADPNMPHMAAEQRQHIPQRDSTDSVLQPPEPTFSTKPRIASIPPMLPEIQLQERPFSPVTMDFPVAPSSVRPTPSPFSTSFTIPSPPPNAHFPEDAAPPSEPATPAAHPTARAPASVPAAKRPDTVYTLYDDEDAYGGM